MNAQLPGLQLMLTQAAGVFFSPLIAILAMSLGLVGKARLAKAELTEFARIVRIFAKLGTRLARIDDDLYLCWRSLSESTIPRANSLNFFDRCQELVDKKNLIESFCLAYVSSNGSAVAQKKLQASIKTWKRWRIASAAFFSSFMVLLPITVLFGLVAIILHPKYDQISSILQIILSVVMLATIWLESSLPRYVYGPHCCALFSTVALALHYESSSNQADPKSEATTAKIVINGSGTI